MSKPDENRRRILKLTGGVILGGSLLYGEQIREFLSGADHQHPDGVGPTPTEEPTATPTERRDGVGDGGAGKLPRQYTVTDQELESFAQDSPKYDNILENIADDSGTDNNFYIKDGKYRADTSDNIHEIPENLYIEVYREKVDN